MVGEMPFGQDDDEQGTEKIDTEKSCAQGRKDRPEKDHQTAIRIQCGMEQDHDEQAPPRIVVDPRKGNRESHHPKHEGQEVEEVERAIHPCHKEERQMPQTPEHSQQDTSKQGPRALLQTG